jgi:hypothetical protein
VTRKVPATAPISAGGRIDLRLESDGSEPGGRVEYEARWFIGEEPAVEGRVFLPPHSPRDVQIVSDSPLPDWLQTFTVTLLRTLARGAPPWPRRLTRWREER